MQKIVVHRPGGYTALQLEEHPDLEPISDQVVVAVAASGVNYADGCVRWGVYESARKFVGWPITPGFEFAGTVKKVGKGVSRWQVGDRVFGISFFVAAVVGSAHKVDYVRSLGADLVVDKSSEPLWPRVKAWAPGGFDAVLSVHREADPHDLTVSPGPTPVATGSAPVPLPLRSSPAGKTPAE